MPKLVRGHTLRCRHPSAIPTGQSCIGVATPSPPPGRCGSGGRWSPRPFPAGPMGPR
jgi:hypothetical protein